MELKKRLDQLGRVHIPRAIRLLQGFEPECEVVLVSTKEGVLIRKASD